MTENDVVTILNDFISKQFPKECHCCGKRYNSLREYIQNTTRQGKMSSYGAKQVNWNPEKPIGAMAMVNCSCGTTMAIGTKDMDPQIISKLFEWAQTEGTKRGVSFEDLLNEIRDKIAERTMKNSEQKV